jgi:hypothetical protein
VAQFKGLSIFAPWLGIAPARKTFLFNKLGNVIGGFANPSTSWRGLNEKQDTPCCYW